MLCAEKGARLRVAPVDDHGQVLLDQYERLQVQKLVWFLWLKCRMPWVRLAC